MGRRGGRGKGRGSCERQQAGVGVALCAMHWKEDVGRQAPIHRLRQGK